MTIHPVENHGKLQADVNRLMVTESKLKKKIASEEDASKAARIVRDYLAKARVLLISLKPTITISEAHHHPLVNSELPCFLSFFDSRFSISNRTIRLHLPMQLQERRDALPCSAAPVVVSMGCSVNSTRHPMKMPRFSLFFLLRINMILACRTQRARGFKA